MGVRSAFLDEAQPEQLSRAVRDVLERRGALVVEHRHSRVRFTSQAGRSLSWLRSGYVGIYQHAGEQEAEVRLRLRARWPWRILWIVALANVLVTAVAFVVNPNGTTWSLLAIVTGFALLAAGLVYVATLKGVREDERRLMEEFEAEFERDLPEASVESEEERELRELEAALEGEITRRRLDRSRPAPAGRRFSLQPRKGSAEETPEDRRARLLARKAELEARRREREGEP